MQIIINLFLSGQTYLTLLQMVQIAQIGQLRTILGNVQKEKTRGWLVRAWIKFMDQLMRLVDNEIMDRPTHHNTCSLFTAPAHPTYIIAIIICRSKCYKGQQKKQQRDKRVHCTFYGIYTASQNWFSQKYVVQNADDFREERDCGGQLLQPTCFQKQLDVSWYFHNFVYSNTPRRFKNQLVLAK